MTEKLYYKDSYIKSFTATVLSCERSEGGFTVILDRTAFFPEEAGQYCDRGEISGVEVFSVTEEDGVILHKVTSPLAVGQEVEGNILFDERFEKMQCHSAEHILSGLFHSKFGLENVGFHLGAEDVTMDISAPLSWESLMEIERMANEVVFENVPITEIYPTPEELGKIEYRSKLDLTENVRIVKIGEYDSCACCAPHVKHTGEIGSIKILDAVKLRGGMRIFITAGRRAYGVYRAMYKNLAAISRALSVPKLDTAPAVTRLLEAYEEKKTECKAARLAYFEREAELVERTAENAVIVFSDATAEELRAFANIAVTRVGGVLVLLAGAEPEYKYIIASASVNLREEVRKINAALCGKGGGTPSMVQGSLCAALDEIKEYFKC
ncbi:MAG: alanyl-tRNA editing protein [Clostridia bacterium]|nr:alanyl-tRNA editing protein [Clostridia bacterium]